MQRHTIAATVLFGILVGCYQDDVLHPAAIAPTKVFLTDSPFPFDTVGSVNIYVTKIEASTGLDTTDQTGSWVTIATPNKSFDLLTLQQGDTAFVGQGMLDAGKYAAIRMTIDVDQSSIKYEDGTNAVVQWPYPGHGPIVLYAVVERPLSVAATGTVIVIDFDVGRTFLYNLYGGHDFVMVQGTLRAVNSAVSGTIAGIVTRSQDGGFVPVSNADVFVYGGNPNLPIATGRTATFGDYHVGFLGAGTYTVRIEQPSMPWLAAVTTSNVQVAAGAVESLSVVLPPAGTGGSFIHVTGPDSVGVYGAIILHASVGDSNGVPEANPNVTWFTRDPSIALVSPDTPSVADSLGNAIVGGVSVGTTWIVATSGPLADSLSIKVISPAPPPPGVATVTIAPPSLPNLVVNDSVYLVATLRDSSGNVVSNGTVYWSIVPGQDSTVVDVFSYGLQALVRARRSGSTTVRAIEPIHGAHADAAITVH